MHADRYRKQLVTVCRSLKNEREFTISRRAAEVLSLCAKVKRWASRAGVVIMVVRYCRAGPGLFVVLLVCICCKDKYLFA